MPSNLLGPLLAPVLLALFFSSSPNGQGTQFLYCEDGQPLPVEFLCNGVEDCPSGLDEENCTHHCASYEHKCRDFSSQVVCLNQALVCDGLAHCNDNSDEANCEARECMSGEFRCNDSSCVRLLFRCDEEADCQDGSDELDCPPDVPCPDHMFQCTNGDCIQASWQCDAIPDCDNDEDDCEEEPTSDVCPPELFYCGPIDGLCILPRTVCDGYDDCGRDGKADEEGCTFIFCGDGALACPGPDSCVDAYDQCNGKLDCVDGSDEIGCSNDCEENEFRNHCEENEFRCLSGKCVSYDQVCDGDPHCDDNSDENNCDYVKPVACEMMFPCADGYQCVPEYLQCDGDPHCTDQSDEQFCPSNKHSIDECEANNGGCQGVCHDTLHSYYCTCGDGYRVDPYDHKACIDVDECAEVDTCSQVCTNMDGGYQCSCTEGYEQFSAAGCTASGGSPDPYLLFTNKYDIQRIDLKSLSEEKVVVNLSSAMGIDYHYRLGRIFWSDVMEGAIMTAAMDGTNATVVIGGLNRPEGLAVDWIHDKLFWTDSLKGTVEVTSFDGTVHAVLYSGLSFPRGIAVDPFKGILYWTEHQGRSPAIKYGPVDGSEANYLHANGLYFPSALALSIPSQTVYWADSLNHVIEASHTDQQGRRPIYTASVNSSFGLTLFEDTMYWTEKLKGTIMAVNRLNGGNATVILGDVYSALDVVAVHPLIQAPATDPDPCTVNNGGCSYLCLVVDGNRSCVCSDDSSLSKDGVSCVYANPIIVFSVTTAIHKSFPQSDQDSFDELLPLDFPVQPDIVALAWESSNSTIFWANLETGSISSATIEGLGQQVIVGDDVRDVGGMAVDWITRKLYWTDRLLEVIFVSNLDGSHKTALITQLDFNIDGGLTDVVVHPIQGWMFWGIRGEEARIMRSRLDGSDITVFLKYSTSNVMDLLRNGNFTVYSDGYPISMVIDYKVDRLYWLDHNWNALFSMELNGSDVELITKKPKSPVGLAENKGFLYYLELEQSAKTIFSVSKNPPYESSEYLQTTASHLRALTVFHHERERLPTHPCLTDNGGCSHLCLTHQISDGGAVKITCACPTGLLISGDGKTCKSKPDKYFVFSSDSRLSWLSSDTGYDLEATIPISPTPEGVSAIEVDWDHNKVYWADRAAAVIYRADLLSGEREVVIDRGLVEPTAIALDWAGQKLYWADSGTQRIEVSRTDGSFRKVLVHGNNVRRVISLALDLKLHYMFWISHGNNPQIQRAGMDGEGLMTVVSQPDVTGPMAVVVDNLGPSGRVLVADFSRNKIYSFDVDGEDKIVLASLGYPPQGIAVDEEFIYWVDTIRIDDMVMVNDDWHKLYRADKFNGNKVKALARIAPTVFGFQLAFQRDRGSLHYPCVNVKQCSKLCLPNSDHEYYTCACPTGILLNSDQFSCPKFPSQYLLFPMRGLVARISLDTQDFTEVVLASVEPSSSANFIDYFLKSPYSGSLFWSQGNDIFTADLDGDNPRPFQSGLEAPTGVAVDWSTGNVYFASSTSGRIETVSSDSLYRKQLVQIEGGLPMGLALLPQEGKMFWSDWGNGRGARIEVASMDGSNRKALVTSDLGQPSQLVINDGCLYWVDTTKNTLERVKMDGSDRETVFTGLTKPFGLAVLDESVFWSDQETGRIVQEPKPNRLDKEIYVDMGVGVPRGLAIVSTARLGELNTSQPVGPCSYANGNCTHLCLPITSTERMCACPDMANGQLSPAGDCVEETGTPPPPTSLPASVTPTDYTPSTPSTFRPATTDDVVTGDLPLPPDANASPSNVDSSGNSSSGDYQFSSVEIAFLSIIIVILLVIVMLVGAIFFMAVNQRGEYSPALSRTNDHSLQLLQVKNPLYQEVDTKDALPSKSPSLIYNNAGACKSGSLTRNLKPLTPKRSPVSKSGSGSVGPVKISSATASSLGLHYHGVEPSTYRITPVPPRRKSASSPPPGSPIAARADVHFSLDTSQNKLQPATPTRIASPRYVPQPERKKKPHRPPLAAPKELSVRDPASKKSVKFDPKVDLSNPLPPPLPPRMPTSSPSPPSYDEVHVGSLPVPIRSQRSVSSPSSSSEDGEETTLFLGKSVKPSVPTVSIAATNPHAVSPERSEESDCELPPKSL